MFGIPGLRITAAGDTRGMGETKPEYRADSDRYSFAKAPRYKEKVVQLGPLAELIIAGDPLITSFFRAEGPNTWLRQFARLHRPVIVLRANAKARGGPNRKCRRAYFRKVGAPKRGRQDMGSSMRRVGVWVIGLQIAGGKIKNYQVITPTTWNGSPRDSCGQAGPLGGKLYRPRD